MPSPLITTTDLKRYYKRGPQEVKALDGVSISIERGEFVGIVGSSGSGKSTLVSLLAGLDTPSAGAVTFGGSTLTSLNRWQLSRYRAEKVGIIFQSFNLISHYTALENVAAALLFSGIAHAERERRAAETLELLGLGARITHRPGDLSGGEQQRVAVARAIIKQPEILFADEPTGNLDLDNALQIAGLMHDLNDAGLTIVLVTHNLEIAERYARRTIKMQYGKVSA
jgi:putative ABC transport system ATP-binding protein